jgi:SAM-dependent methyltransferase
MNIQYWLEKYGKLLNTSQIYDDWQRMQKYYNPHQDKQIEVIRNFVMDMNSPRDITIDLCCGPGTLTHACKRLDRDARIIGIDKNSFLLYVYNNLNRKSQDVSSIEADIRQANLYEKLPKVSNVMSLNSLHWLSKENHMRLYKSIFNILDDGGIFINADRLHEKEVHSRKKYTWDMFWNDIYKKYNLKFEIEDMDLENKLWEGTDDGYSKEFYMDTLHEAGFTKTIIPFIQDNRIVYYGLKV